MLTFRVQNTHARLSPPRSRRKIPKWCNCRSWRIFYRYIRSVRSGSTTSRSWRITPDDLWEMGHTWCFRSDCTLWNHGESDANRDEQHASAIYWRCASRGGGLGRSCTFWCTRHGVSLVMIEEGDVKSDGRGNAWRCRRQEMIIRPVTTTRVNDMDEMKRCKPFAALCAKQKEARILFREPKCII